MTILCAVPECPGIAIDHHVCRNHCDCYRCTEPFKPVPL
jgi:hypothetical protein